MDTAPEPNNSTARVPRVFISYSHDSSEHMNRVLALCNHIRSEGIDCRLDRYEQSPPKGWPRWMQNEIREADFVLVICTETYKRRFEGLESRAVGKGAKWEGAIITRQIYEAEGENTKFIPVVFTTEDQVCIPDVLYGATYYNVSTSDGYDLLYRRLSGQPAFPPPPIAEKLRPMPPLRIEQHFPPMQPSKAERSEHLTVSYETAQGLLFLLVLDQYPAGGWPEGVWGRSLAPTSGFYGHEGDPGSISVSCWAAQALAASFPQEKLPEISKFREYLLSRRKANGGIGMRKSVGSGKAKKYDIIVNRRHTAPGAKFLVDFGDSLDLGLLSLRYVIEHRTPSGGWSGIGDVADGNADPLTTAYVLRVLRDFDSRGLLHSISFKDREQFLKTYWKGGCLWLYRSLIRNGWWLYKTEDEPISDESMSRAYCDTGDTLMAIPEFGAEDTEYASAHSRVVETLKKLWDENGVGIPNGVGTDQPSLEATVYLARTCWLCHDRYLDFANDVAGRFVVGLEALLENGSSGVAGWSMTLSFLNNLRALTLKPDSLEHARNQAKATWSAMQTGGLKKAVSIMSEQPAWVREIAKQRILPVCLTPP
jgi:hypothetical protein